MCVPHVKTCRPHVHLVHTHVYHVCTPCTVVPHVCIPHVQYTFMYVYIDICSMYVCEASCTCHVCTDASYSCGTCTHVTPSSLIITFLIYIIYFTVFYIPKTSTCTDVTFITYNLHASQTQ